MLLKDNIQRLFPLNSPFSYLLLAISNYFSLRMRIQNSEVQLYSFNTDLSIDITFA